MNEQTNLTDQLTSLPPGVLLILVVLAAFGLAVSQFMLCFLFPKEARDDHAEMGAPPFSLDRGWLIEKI